MGTSDKCAKQAKEKINKSRPKSIFFVQKENQSFNSKENGVLRTDGFEKSHQYVFA